MLGPPGGVRGARYKPAIGEELFGRGEAVDAIDLRVDGEGVDLADAGDQIALQPSSVADPARQIRCEMFPPLSGSAQAR